MPLKDGRRDNLRKLKRDTVQHAGLFLDKMLWWPEPALRKEQGNDGAAENKEALREVLEAVPRIDVPPGYRRAFHQREALLNDFAGNVENGVTCLLRAAAKGRLVVNLGAAAVRETNIALLHTWGVPYIPGSALKGMASATAHQSGLPDWQKPRDVEQKPQGRDHRLLFGDTDEAGHVVFHDAWWCPNSDKLPLDLDTMTVHHPDYYQSGGTPPPPADWDEPRPVPFLTTKGEFLIALTGPKQWVQAAFEWLAIGLEHDGIGAKTAAGYGRMCLDLPWLREKRERENEERKERENQQKRLESDRNRLNALVVQFKDKSNARQIFEQVQGIAVNEALHEAVQRALRNLYARDKDCWDDWLKTRATQDQVALAERFQMRPADAVPKVDPRPAADAGRAVFPPERGYAWIARDRKNRQTFYFATAIDRRPEDRNIKDVRIDSPELEEALRAAGPESPIAVEVSRDGKKIARVRRLVQGG